MYFTYKPRFIYSVGVPMGFSYTLISSKDRLYDCLSPEKDLFFGSWGVWEGGVMQEGTNVLILARTVQDLCSIGF